MVRFLISNQCNYYWCSFAVLLSLTGCLNGLPHQKLPKVEPRCVIVNKGLCTVNEKNDLCLFTQIQTRRPRNQLGLIRIETIVKSTGPLPEQRGNVTIDIRCKLLENQKCWPLAQSSSSVPSDEEIRYLTIPRMSLIDPEFKEHSRIAEVKRAAAYKAQVTDFVNPLYQSYYSGYFDKSNPTPLHHRRFSPEQMAEIDSLITMEEKDSKREQFFEENKNRTVDDYVNKLIIPTVEKLANTFELTYTDPIHMKQIIAARRTQGEILRDQFCNSGKCDRTTGTCSELLCGTNMKCETESMDMEFEHTMRETLKKVRNGSSQITVFNVMVIVCMLTFLCCLSNH